MAARASTSQGAIESSQPVLLFAVAFGLSTDYGVFLLGRIKELHDAGLSNEEAVALGLQRTGRIVTFAALLMVIAIGCFVTAQVIFIKQLGFGVALAVLIDATIVRALLVPALMRLLGRLELVGAASARQTAARRETRSATSGWAPTSATGGRTCRRRSRCCGRTTSSVLASSSVYETEPVGEVLDQREFYNACVRIETRARAGGAARRVQGGRARVRARAGGRGGYVKHGPRPIDVDVLLLGRRRVRVRAADAAAPRGARRGASCSCRCSSSTRDLEVPGRGPRRRRARARSDGQDVRRAGPPLEVGP